MTNFVGHSVGDNSSNDAVLSWSTLPLGSYGRGNGIPSSIQNGHQISRQFHIEAPVDSIGNDEIDRDE